MPEVKYVALLGDFSRERVDLRSIAANFGWSVLPVADVAELKRLRGRCDLAVVMIHAKTLDAHWSTTLHRVGVAVPEARTVICHGMDQAHGRRDMLDRGAYGVLRTPLDHGEVQQMLGFAWAVQNRLPNGSENLFLSGSPAEVAREGGTHWRQ